MKGEIDMALTKKQIKEFKESEKDAADSIYDLLGIADDIAEAGDKEWVEKIYKKSEVISGDSSDCRMVADSIHGFHKGADHA